MYNISEQQFIFTSKNVSIWENCTRDILRLEKQSYPTKQVTEYSIVWPIITGRWPVNYSRVHVLIIIYWQNTKNDPNLTLGM